jgi:hypothetical protein
MPKHPLDIRALLVAFTCAGVVAAGCGSAGKKADTTTGTAPMVRYIPGGDDHEVSPLAQLMRKMVAFTDTTGKHLATGGDLPPFPTAFKAILTAEATPGMMDHVVFDPFAFAWLQQLDSLYKTPMASRSEVFNGLVQRCANCHGEVCPGPLDRIKKLKIADLQPIVPGPPDRTF